MVWFAEFSQHWTVEITSRHFTMWQQRWMLDGNIVKPSISTAYLRS
jgi:hypothetical protein